MQAWRTRGEVGPWVFRIRCGKKQGLSHLPQFPELERVARGGFLVSPVTFTRSVCSEVVREVVREATDQEAYRGCEAGGEGGSRSGSQSQAEDRVSLPLELPSKAKA